MSRKPTRTLRAIAEPVLVRPPFLVRACNAFVNGLPLILRLAFLAGVVVLAQNFDDLTDKLPRSAHRVELPPAAVQEQPVDPDHESEDAVLSDRVLHYLNCTYEDYRAAHFDECVEAPSDIYRNTQADPDDIGMVSRDTLVLLARLEDTNDKRPEPY